MQRKLDPSYTLRMYVRWQHRKRASSAILVETARVKGKPTQRHLAYLGGIADATDSAQRHRFWASVLAVLARLGNQITPAQRKAIIAALATRAPGPPTKIERAQ